MKSRLLKLLWVVAGCCWMLTDLPKAQAAAETSRSMEVQDENTFVYLEPSDVSPVIRRIFVGEIIKPVEQVVSEDGKIWIKIELGNRQAGYVPSNKLLPIEGLAESRFVPSMVVRDENPLSFGVRAFGETLGVALNLRYMFMTRLGLAIGGGTVFDGWNIQGTMFSMAFVANLALGNISPTIEVGVQNLGYYSGNSNLRIWALFTFIGLEWMFDWGGYISVGGVISKSLDMEVCFKWEDTQGGNLVRDSYGRFEKMISRNSFLTIQPSITIGYGF